MRRWPSSVLRSSAVLSLAVLSAAVSAGPIETGNAALAEKRWAAAADSFQEAVKATPGSKDALRGLARAVAEGRLADRYDSTQTALFSALKAGEDRSLRVALARLFSARAEQDPRYHADVEEQYRRVLKADPADEDAVVGTALMYLARADHARGLETLAPLLAQKPGSAAGLRAKGEILYDQAVLSYQQARKVEGETKSLFEQAKAAFQASTAADPASFDAWLKLGYTAQYLSLAGGSAAEAGAAYEKALALDGESELPLKGLFAVYGREWNDRVAKLAAAHPDAPRVQFWLADALYKAGKPAEAEAAVRRHLSLTKQKKDAGHVLLGQILTAKGDEAGAAKAFEEALKDNPDHPGAIEPLEVRAREALQRVADDPAKLKAGVAEYRSFLAKTPRYVFGRNNLGLILRDAFGQSGQRSGPSKPRWMLDESVKAYEEAAALIGEWRPEYERTYPYALRHAYAQVLNDTGLMYQYYPEVEDLAKAESYYRLAQEWSQHGYWDAYTNLMRILTEKERWADALEYAEACAEGLKNESGEPNDSQRATAAGQAEQLRKKVGAADAAD